MQERLHEDLGGADFPAEAVIFPETSGLPESIVVAVTRAGLRLRIASSIETVFPPMPRLLLVNIGALGRPDRSGEALRCFVETKLRSAVADVPVIVIEAQGSHSLGWGGSGVEAYYYPTGDDSRLVELIRRLVPTKSSEYRDSPSALDR